MWREFDKLCNPAKFYFVIAMLSVVLGIFANFRVFFILTKLIFAFIYTFVLNFLCKKGYKYFAWFLVLLPYILMFMVFMDFRMSQIM